ncbi:MAG: hypothetical protein A2156_01390 [Deltaproteobacteria bacterium RBG_16_48_10]|nr:MAG: hypothetical protein A2156_01390 [Deltaproteobacteria bacterium RBG_16_48_10]
MAERLTVFDPTTTAEGQTITFAPRPKSLRNLRIGLVDNTKFNSDKLLLRIASILEREHGARGHLLHRKRNSSVPVDEEAINEYIGNCDVVVAGIGD